MIPFPKPPMNLKQQTQKALRIINQHQRMKNLQIATMLNFQTQPNSSATFGPFKIFQPKQKIKVQLLPNTLRYYKMQLQSNIDPKIVVRQFRGGPVDIFLCFDKLHKDLEKSAYHFVAKDQMILKFAKKYIEEAKSLIIVFKNGSNLSHFLFRVDIIRPKKPKSDMDKSASVLELEEININEVKLLRSKSSKVKLNKIVSTQSLDMVFLKPEDKLKRISQRRELSQERKQAAMKRLENIQINQKKSAEALKVVSSCKKMFHTYQDLVSEEETKKIALLKMNTPLLYAIKYCFLSSMFFNERQRNMRRVITIKSYEKKFIRKIRRAYRETKALVPDRNVRQLEVLKQVGSFLGYSLNKVSMKRSIKIAVETFKRCLPGFLINLAMNQSNNYRRVIRVIQRRWKSKFEARNTMLLNYCQQQLKVILKAYPHLEYVAKQYRETNKAYGIVLQYQKQTASKMKDLIFVYNQKLAQIREYEQINKQIRKFNQTCLKKKIKQLLEIPKKPAFPEFRFFRDVLFIKSMVRGQLQLLFRKFKKKNPQLFVQKQQETPPKKQQLRKSK